MASKRIAAAAFVAVAVFVAVTARAQNDDDWHVVERHMNSAPRATAPPAASAPISSSPARSASANQTSSDDTVTVCGEKARPAQQPYSGIMATLNGIWHSNVPIYESVASMSPHARTGGCVFYNRRKLSFLTQQWMGVRDPEQLQPLLYAIFAHELGHVLHGDVAGARENTPIRTRELEADRFAGFTLFKLNMRVDADDMAGYFRIVSDDFTGVRADHGTGNQRSAAFKSGFDLARMGLAEDTNQRPVGGLDPDAAIGESTTQ
ncbi:MAG TPA: hypothetical protein VEF03_00025 [Candidatus Binataceae bacterium]|nr:hypothetical protein [Candidatus Binataceae bacterium]